jgi:hypothetical protein
VRACVQMSVRACVQMSNPERESERVLRVPHRLGVGRVRACVQMSVRACVQMSNPERESVC